MLALRDLKVLERKTGAAVQDCAVLRTYYKQRRIVVVREGGVRAGCYRGLLPSDEALQAWLPACTPQRWSVGDACARTGGLESDRDRQIVSQAGRGGRESGTAMMGGGPYKYFVMGVYASVSFIHNFVFHMARLCSDAHSDLSEHTREHELRHSRPPPTSPSHTISV